MSPFKTDKDRGLQKKDLAEVLSKSFKDIKDPNFKKYCIGQDYLKVKANGDEEGNVWPRTPGSSDSGDFFDSIIKPKSPVWTKEPSEEEEGIYYGLHIHSESNPLGIHTHIIGGKLGGAHTHGPSNKFGTHHHKEKVEQMTNTDGMHIHNSNHIDGKHEHCPDNFG